MTEIDVSVLWPHQIETYEFGKERDAVFCTSSPGVGKSLPHAKIIEDAFKNKGCTRALIICPKSLIFSAWGQELGNHTDLTFAAAEAPEEKRIAAFESDAQVIITNTDAVSWLIKQPKRWLLQVLGNNAILVVDESSTFKNPNAKRTKAFVKLSPFFTRRFLLAGTPAPNSITEIWSQVFALDGGIRLGKRFTAFRNIMQTPVNKGPFVTWVDKPEAQQVAYGLINDIVIHHEFSDVMDKVPALAHTTMSYELSSRHMEYYKKLEEEAYLELKGKTITAVNAGALAGKLLQAASGAVYTDGKGQEWQVLDRGRYELIAQLVQERQHSLCFFHWNHQRMVLEEEFNKAGITYDVIDGTVKSASKGAESVSRVETVEDDTLLLQP
jgi:hypothetical protein